MPKLCFNIHASRVLEYSTATESKLDHGASFPGETMRFTLVGVSKNNKPLGKERFFSGNRKTICIRIGLRRPIYLPTAAYGHFGRAGFPWEEVRKDI